MAEDIVKLLSPPGSPITLVFWPRHRYPIPRGTASVVAQNTRGGGWGKFVIFDRNRRLSRKRYEIGPWLLLNAYMKSYALYRMTTFSRTFTDPYPDFQGHSIFYVEYLKNFFCPWLTDKLLLNSNRKRWKPYIVYQMVPFSMTLSDLWPGIQSHDIFEYLKNLRKKLL